MGGVARCPSWILETAEHSVTPGGGSEVVPSSRNLVAFSTVVFEVCMMRHGTKGVLGPLRPTTTFRSQYFRDRVPQHQHRLSCRGSLAHTSWGPRFNNGFYHPEKCNGDYGLPPESREQVVCLKDAGTDPKSVKVFRNKEIEGN
eukprot:747684-Rhodomonas_salina.1